MSQFIRNILGFEESSSPVLDFEDSQGFPPYNHGNNGKGNRDSVNKKNRLPQLQFNGRALESAAIPFENEAVQFWKVYFDFAFFALLSPFRFIWDPQTGFYYCYSSKMQRTMQWIFCIFCTTYFLFRVQNMSKLNPEEHPTLYFDMAYYFFDTTVMVTLFLCFGTQKPFVERVFRELQLNNRTFYADAVNKHKTIRKSTWICLGCLGTLILQILETLLDQNWDFARFMEFWEMDGAEVFHHHSLTKRVPFLFGCLALASSLFEKLLNAFADILFTMTVLMFDTLVNSFDADMKNERHFQEFESSIRVLEHYWWLKYVTGKINNAMNLIIGAFVAGNLPFFATNVFEVFGDGNIFMRIRYMFYCAYWFPSLFIAANANRKIEEVKSWICKEENYSKLPPVKLQVFLHEVDDYTIGMCSYGIMTVTWQTVGSIISIILTYALMKSQFKAETPAGDEVLKEIQRNFTMMTNWTNTFPES